MELIQTKLTESETMSPMPSSKPNKGHNGIPEFMTHSEIKENQPSPVKEPGIKEPGIKEKPKERPKHPGQRPTETPDPGPKAKKEMKEMSPEEGKTKIINVIKGILQK